MNLQEYSIVSVIISELIHLNGGGPIFLSEEMVARFNPETHAARLEYSAEKRGWMIDFRNIEIIEGEVVAG